MTVASTTNRVVYTGNGVTTAFAFNYPVFAATDLVVIRHTIATGAETTLVLNTDYTVSIASDNLSATVTAASAPSSAYKWVIYRDVPATQSVDLVENGVIPMEALEDALDRMALTDQRTRELANRSIHLSEGFNATFDMTLPVTLTPDYGLAVNSDGDGWTLVDLSLLVDLETAVDGATASATAAAASASAASTSASAASTSASTASAAATAASAAVDSVIFRDVDYKTASFSVTDADRGKMFSVDCTAGAVTVTLPQISGLTLTDPWTIAIKKTDSSGNAITINRAGTDTIEGSTSKGLSSQGAGVWLVPDTDQSPDQWAFMEIGSASLPSSIDVTSVTADTLTQDVASGTAGAINLTSQAQGDLIYRNATGWVRLAAGTAGQYLRTGGAAADPTWSSTLDITSVTADTLTQDVASGTAGAINLTSQAAGDILRYNSGWSRLAIGSTNAVLTVSGGQPAWTLTPTGLTSISANTVTQAAAAGTVTAINLTSEAQGDILYRNASGWVRLAAGTNNQLLKTSGAAANPAWVTVTGGDVGGTPGALTVTDLTIASEAQGDILYFNGTNWVRLAAGTNNQVLKTAGAAANPSWVTMIGGDVGGTPGALTVTDLTITSEAQGSVLYFNGTNWVQLSPGTSGHFLRTNGAAANPSWAAASATEATQAEMEGSLASGNWTFPTATSFPTARRVHFHPGVAKAWCRWDNTSTIVQSMNVTSITDNAAGDWTITFAADFSSSSAYVCVATARGTSSRRIYDTISHAAGSVRVESFNDAGSLTDPVTGTDLVCFGDLA